MAIANLSVSGRLVMRGLEQRARGTFEPLCGPAGEAGASELIIAGREMGCWKVFLRLPAEDERGPFVSAFMRITDELIDDLGSDTGRFLAELTIQRRERRKTQLESAE